MVARGIHASIPWHQVFWHRHEAEVPTGCPTIFIAHELLDALPVHQFQRVNTPAPPARITIEGIPLEGLNMQRISTMPVHRPAPPQYKALVDQLQAAKSAAGAKQVLWRERMVTTDLSEQSPYHFRFVLAPGDTPASAVLLKRRLAAMDPQGRG